MRHESPPDSGQAAKAGLVAGTGIGHRKHGQMRREVCLTGDGVRLAKPDDTKQVRSTKRAIANDVRPTTLPG
jgi:hypothetical protein